MCLLMEIDSPLALSPTRCGILGNITVAVVSTLNCNESVYVQP